MYDVIISSYSSRSYRVSALNEFRSIDCDVKNPYRLYIENELKEENNQKKQLCKKSKSHPQVFNKVLIISCKIHRYFFRQIKGK